MKNVRWLLLAGLLAVGGLAAATPVHADTTYNVNTPADTPGLDCTSTCSLRSALQLAQNVLPPATVTINLPANTYSFEGIHGAPPQVLHNLILNGAGSASTIIDGSYQCGDFTCYLSPFQIGAGAVASISGVTVRNGRNTNGGAIVNQGSLTLNNVSLHDNQAFIGGGAIFNNGGPLHISNSTLTHNRVTGSGASPILWGGAILSTGGTLTLTATTVSGNDVTKSANDDRILSGGGISATDTSVTVISSTISDNHATATCSNGYFGVVGGGIAVNYGVAGSLNMTASSITANSAEACGHGYPSGGGIYSSTNSILSDSHVDSNTVTQTDPFNPQASGGGIVVTGTLNMSGGTINRNQAIGNAFGGGLVALNSTIAISNATISGNSGAVLAGGMWIGSGSVTGSTISENSTSGDGGGIYTGAHTLIDLLTLTNDTISGNTAARGGALFHGQSGDASKVLIRNVTAGPNTATTAGPGIHGRATLKDSIVAAGANGCFNLPGDGNVSQGYNLEVGGNSCGLSGPGDKPGLATALLGPLGANGGPTLTMALLPGSPAIRAGGPSCPDTDQRGVSRHNPCDIGAYEYQFTAPALSIASSANPSAQGQPVTLSLNVAGAAGPGSGGTATFKEGSTVLGTAPSSNGNASLTLSSLSLGAHSITADYSGDLQYGPGSASALSQSVIPAPAGNYRPVPPYRLIDTRESGHQVGPGESLEVQVAGSGGGAVPQTGAGAVVLNVTAVGSSQASYLTVYPAGTERPTASNLNFAGGQTIANLVVVPLGSGGRVDFYNNVGSTDVVVDVEGWYTAVPTGLAGLFSPVAPVRLLDTRSELGGHLGRLGPGQSLDLEVAGSLALPQTHVSAVVLNVTAVDSSQASYLTVYPSGLQKPLVSNLNFPAHKNQPNRAMVKLGAQGKVTLYNDVGDLDVVVDLGGWYGDGLEGGSTGGYFHPLLPGRVYDSRETGGKLSAHEDRPVQVAGQKGVPQSGALAVILNTTLTEPDSPSYLTVHPSGGAPPVASDLNCSAGETIPNLVVVKLGADGRVGAYNDNGTAHFIFDALGWFG